MIDMNYIDVFNGDADGICALLQLRQCDPQASELITGIKRDIKLLNRVVAQTGDKITVLDISLDKNRDGLLRLLKSHIKVLYIDHHFAGEIPEHPQLTSVINTDADTCTSLLVDQHLHGRHREWAITGAYGDNLWRSAEVLADSLSLSEIKAQQLKQLGTYINYNGYGSVVEDLHFAPDRLFKIMLPYHSPFDFMNDAQSVFGALKAGYEEDMAKTRSVQAEYSNEKVAVYVLEDAAWARRVGGVYSNDLANNTPEKAHAVLTHNKEGGYMISVRAPLVNKTGADDLCRKFPSGGGRKAAAGINHLDKIKLTDFINIFAQHYH